MRFYEPKDWPYELPTDERLEKNFWEIPDFILRLIKEINPDGYDKINNNSK